jgi:hypothetical protein
VKGTITLLTSVSLVAGNLVAWSPSGVVLADAATNYEILGVAKAAFSAGSMAIIYTVDGQDLDVLFDAAPLTSQEGRPVYLSAVAGKASMLPSLANGTTVVRVGLLLEADGISDVTKLILRPQAVARTP